MRGWQCWVMWKRKPIIGSQLIPGLLKRFGGPRIRGKYPQPICAHDMFESVLINESQVYLPFKLFLKDGCELEDMFFSMLCKPAEGSIWPGTTWCPRRYPLYARGPMESALYRNQTNEYSSAIRRRIWTYSKLNTYISYKFSNATTTKKPCMHDRSTKTHGISRPKG